MDMSFDAQMMFARLLAGAALSKATEAAVKKIKTEFRQNVLNDDMPKDVKIMSVQIMKKAMTELEAEIMAEE